MLYINDTDSTEGETFRCLNGVLLAKNKVCDGVRDCPCCSDELNCPGSYLKFFKCYNHG